MNVNINGLLMKSFEIAEVNHLKCNKNDFPLASFYRHHNAMPLKIGGKYVQLPISPSMIFHREHNDILYMSWALLFKVDLSRPMV